MDGRRARAGLAIADSPVAPSSPDVALRRAVNESEASLQQIERDTGVLRQSLMKFARGEQSLRLNMADTLAAYFDLEVVQRGGQVTASVVNRPNGRREIQYADGDGKRHTIRLGKMPKRDAESIKTRIEKLLVAKISKYTLDVETAKWVADLDDLLANRLAAVGLIDPWLSSRLGEFLDGYVNGRTDVKPRTVIKFKTTKDDLVEFFGSDRNLRSVSPANADDWRIFLIGKKMGDNTVRKHTQIAKQFFYDAVRRKLIESNPFADLESTVRANPERFYFVDVEKANKVLDACPDARWRLIFALSRFGGLRCPSEHLELRTYSSKLQRAVRM